MADQKNTYNVGGIGISIRAENPLVGKPANLDDTQVFDTHPRILFTFANVRRKMLDKVLPFIEDRLAESPAFSGGKPPRFFTTAGEKPKFYLRLDEKSHAAQSAAVRQALEELERQPEELISALKNPSSTQKSNIGLYTQRAQRPTLGDSYRR